MTKHKTDKVTLHKCFAPRKRDFSRTGRILILAILALLLTGYYLIVLLVVLIGFGVWVYYKSQNNSKEMSDHEIFKTLQLLTSVFPVNYTRLVVDPFGKQHTIKKFDVSALCNLELRQLPNELIRQAFTKMSPKVDIQLTYCPVRAKEQNTVLAALAFEHLDSENLYQSLTARHMLSSLIQKDPGYFMPLDATDKVVYWKHWLLETYGEIFEILTFQLERRSVMQSFYVVVLPGALLAGLNFFLFKQHTPFLIGLFCYAACMAYFVVIPRVRLLLKFKSIIKSMQRWHGEHAGMNVSAPALSESASAKEQK